MWPQGGIPFSSPSGMLRLVSHVAWVVDEFLLLQKHVPRGDLWWEMGEGGVRKKSHLLGVLSTLPPSSDHRLTHMAVLVTLARLNPWGIRALIGFPSDSAGKQFACNAGDSVDAGLIPGSGRSSGEGNGNPLQYSCLGNPRTEEAGGLQSMGLQRWT